MLVGLHVNKSSYFIYDPMADKGQRESVARALNMYIHLECESFVNWNEADDLSSHKMMINHVKFYHRMGGPMFSARGKINKIKVTVGCLFSSPFSELLTCWRTNKKGL